jgi:hypothetical protein
VPVAESFFVSGAPSLYGLVEVRDTYHRYVAALATKQWVGVFEVNLGSVTRHISSRRPTLRARRSNGSSKNDCDSRRRERISQYFRDQVRAIEQTMTEGGYAHLVLAGRLAGPGACLEALRAYQTDVLLLTRRRNFDPFWDCSACGRIERDPPRARVCPGCAKAQMRPIDAREEMVRLAIRSGCRIEVVDDNETLRQLGGAGCLLRFMRRGARSRAA